VVLGVVMVVTSWLCSRPLPQVSRQGRCLPGPARGPSPPQWEALRGQCLAQRQARSRALAMGVEGREAGPRPAPGKWRV
jgi:hypothetical protein